MSRIEVCELRVVSGDRMRLTCSSLNFEPGTITAVIGPNGAGKSTLISTIAGELAPTSGQVLMDGVDIATLDARALARRRAVLDQQTEVSFPFTVADVVAWGRHAWRGTPQGEQDDAVIEHALASQGLVELRTRSVLELSGGERRRVQIARVIAQQAPVMLFDEADADLDLVGRAQLDAVMRSHRDTGGTVIASSHDVARIATLADQCVIVGAGRIVASGRPEEVVTAPVLTEAFGRTVDVYRNEAGIVVSLGH